MSPPKCCAVCGDKALGYNFNAVTCESCKAFFRRNALSKKQFTCPFNQNCEITQVTRRFCQKCRLKKCLGIGMKSENIMSDEDKLIKRRKIECNRAKRRLTEQKSDTASQSDGDESQHQQAAADSSSFEPYSSLYDSPSCGSVDSNKDDGEQQKQACRSATLLSEPLHAIEPEFMAGDEIVEFIVNDPDRASQAISKLMRTPSEAVGTLEKIISSQTDALKLISHLIAYPGDALKIISKIMNSPFNALTVFTKFMSSPTDALEIISKIISSPQDVLQFIKNLMDSPENALDIMNKFMNTPAEALRIINRLFNGSNAAASESISTTATTLEQQETGGGDILLPTSANGEDTPFQSPISQMTSPESENVILHSMLNNSPSNSQMMMSPPSFGQTVAPPLPASIQSHSSFPPSPQTMTLTSPMSVGTSSIQFHSPTSMQNDELPSTSAGLIGASPTNSHSDSDFASDQFDIRAFIQNSFPDNSPLGDSVNSLESVLSEVIRIEFQAFNNLPPEPRIKQEQHDLQRTQSQDNQFVTCNPHQQSNCAPSTASMGRDLNEAEQQKIRELKLANEALYYPVDDEISVLMMNDDRIKTDDSHQDPKLLQVINLTAVAIKRLIKMAKKITAFRDMCQEDQVALLKGGCTEMMIMRSVMTYDNNCNTWKIPHTKEDMSNIRAEVLKLAKGNVYEEHIKFMSTFDEKWRMDENIILILCAIVLFSPNRTRVVHSDVIKLEQNSYYYLLRRYLESVYAGCEAKSAFIKLIQKISDVERLNKVMIGVYLNVNPSQVEPLLREIFDLKYH